jgi:integrase
MTGKRRNPYRAVKTLELAYDEELDKMNQKRITIGYYPTKQIALQALSNYNENPYDIETDKISFSAVYDEWSKRQYADWDKSTCRTYISAYNHSAPLHNMIYKTITITNMKDVINNSKVGSATKGRMKSLYNLMGDHAVEAGITPINVARNFAMKGLLKKIEQERVSKKPFTPEDEKKMWEHPDYGFTRMVLIGIYSSWRPDELAILERANVDLENGTMKGGIKTEAGIDRIIPIHSKIRSFVEYYYKESEGCKFLFNDFDGQQGTSMTYDKYRGRFKKVMERFKLEGYTPHCTRHTFITKAKGAKLDEYAIKYIVGHAIDDITEAVYTHRDLIPFLKEEIEKIE